MRTLWTALTPNHPHPTSIASSTMIAYDYPLIPRSLTPWRVSRQLASERQSEKQKIKEEKELRTMVTVNKKTDEEISKTVQVPSCLRTNPRTRAMTDTESLINAGMLTGETTDYPDVIAIIGRSTEHKPGLMENDCLPIGICEENGHAEYDAALALSVHANAAHYARGHKGTASLFAYRPLDNGHNGCMNMFKRAVHDDLAREASKTGRHTNGDLHYYYKTNVFLSYQWYKDYAECYRRHAGDQDAFHHNMGAINIVDGYEYGLDRLMTDVMVNLLSSGGGSPDNYLDLDSTGLRRELASMRSANRERAN